MRGCFPSPARRPTPKPVLPGVRQRPDTGRYGELPMTLWTLIKIVALGWLVLTLAGDAPPARKLPPAPIVHYC